VLRSVRQIRWGWGLALSLSKAQPPAYDAGFAAVGPERRVRLHFAE
jgi:hypothetical protein